MVGSSLYEESMRTNEIDIPRTIIKLFTERGTYIPPLSKGGTKVKLSYRGIEGLNPLPVPREYYNDNSLIASTDEYPLENGDMISEGAAERMVIWALKFIFGGGNQQYGDIKRKYMINTSTVPIKVNFSENRKKSKKIMYAKRPDTNRLIGRFLYDIISGVEPIKWGFNHAVFLEEGVHGTVLAHLNEKVFLNSRAYREGIMRAAVHSAVLGLYCDVVNARNRIVGPNLETILFDFNLIFGPRNEKTAEPLVDKYREIPNFFDDKTIAVYFDERKKIAKRLEAAGKPLARFVKEADKLVDYSGKPLGQRLKEYYGARCLAEYLEKIMETYCMGDC